MIRSMLLIGRVLLIHDVQLIRTVPLVRTVLLICAVLLAHGQVAAELASLEVCRLADSHALSYETEYGYG